MFFFLQLSNISWRNPFVFHKNSGSEFFMHKRWRSQIWWSYQDFPFFSHSTETSRKCTVLCFREVLVSKIFMHKKVISRFSLESFLFLVSELISRCVNKVKNVGKGWDLNPYLLLQKPVVLPTVRWEQLEFLTDLSVIIKIYGPTDSNPGLLLEKRLS